MPNPWTFSGLMLWLGIILLAFYAVAMFLGYAGKWIGI